MTHILRLPRFSGGFGETGAPEFTPEISNLLPGLSNGEILAPDDLILLPDGAAITKTRRLVILVPDNDLDEQELSSRIWQMAAPGALDVLFLSLAPEPDTEAYLRCRLAGLGAMTRDNQVRVSLSFSQEMEWLEAVERVLQPGDLLVCLRDQASISRLEGRTSLVARLADSLGTPVYAMNSLKVGPSQRQVSRRNDWIAWTGFLLTLAVFAWVQIQINESFTGNLWAIFMMGSVLAEIGALWEINEHTR